MQRNQAIGRSRGGRATKIHALCDPEGRLYAPLLISGHVHDIRGVRALVAADPTPRYILRDKAYDSNDTRALRVGQTAESVIPPKALRREPAPFDSLVYRSRTLIERAFCRLKDWRGNATRCDKRATNFLAGVCLASNVNFWLQ